MGSRRRLEIFTYAAAAAALSDAYVGNPIRAPRQRYDLFDVDAARGCSPNYYCRDSSAARVTLRTHRQAPRQSRADGVKA